MQKELESGDAVERCSSRCDKLTCSSSRYRTQVRILATTDLQAVLVIFAQMLRLSKVDCWSCPSLRARKMVQIMPLHTQPYQRNHSTWASALTAAAWLSSALIRPSHFKVPRDGYTRCARSGRDERSTADLFDDWVVGVDVR